MTTRPDQEHFDQFTKPLSVLDGELQQFAQKYGFVLEKNTYRTPCRILRKEGNPHLIVDIYLQENWKEVDLSHSLFYKVAFCGYYKEKIGSGKQWKLSCVISQDQPLGVLSDHLKDDLKKVAQLLPQCDATYIKMHGKEIPDYKEIYPSPLN